MASIWMESSRLEAELAHVATGVVCQLTEKEDVVCEVLEAIAFHVVGSMNRLPISALASRIVKCLLSAVPELASIAVQKPFPEADTDLTSNVFSRLVYEISARLGRSGDKGMVGTPYVLATDMVNSAAAFWLAEQLDCPEEEACSIVWGGSRKGKEKRQIVRDLLAQSRWYDPCVGGGVFPLAIMNLFDRVGIRLNMSTLQAVEGMDISPLCVAATRIRCALAMSALTGIPYEKARLGLSERFQVGDSLKSFAEQNDLPVGDVTTDGRRRVDIVVGNPPYVRSNRIPASVKGQLGRLYPSVAGGTVDLYNYFIANGLLALKPNGVLCYVSPANFQKSRYGAKTRAFVTKHGSVKAIFDFHELPVFSDACLHASVYMIKRSTPQAMIRAYVFDGLPHSAPLSYGLKHAVDLPASNICGSGWHIDDAHTESMLSSLRDRSVSLIDYTGRILSGVKTGYKQAYVLSAKEADELKRDPQSVRFIKPMLRPVSIRPWRATWDGTHMIFVKKGELVPAESLVMQHLSMHESVLRKRIDTLDHPTWYGLRECTYADEFLAPKIIFPDISTKCRFAMDLDSLLIPDGAFFLPLADYFLLGILNSCIGRFYFRARCGRIGIPKKGGRLRFKKTYVSEFPIPLTSADSKAMRARIEELAYGFVNGDQQEDSLAELDELALEIYHVPVESRALFGRDD